MPPLHESVHAHFQIASRIEGYSDGSPLTSQSNASPRSFLHQFHVVHLLQLPIAHLNHVKKEIFLPSGAGRDLDTPLAHHGLVLRLQSAIDEFPVLSGRPELLAGSANLLDRGIGGKQRAAEHPSSILVRPKRVTGQDRLVGRVQKPVLPIARGRRRDTIEHDESIGLEEHELPR